MYPAHAKPGCPSCDNLPLDSLPTELLHEIAAYLSVKDVLSFSRVCKKFNLLSLDILYKKIHTVKSQCLNTIAYNSQIARAVKTFVLPTQINNQPDDRVCTWLGSEDTADVLLPAELAADVKAASILPTLSNLQNLSVPSFSPIYVEPLSQCHFPNFRVLSYAMPITQPITTFLSRSTTLVSLTFDCYLPFHRNLVPRSIVLPELRCLSGSPQVIKLFAEHAPLQNVHIDWKYERANMGILDEALSFLAIHCSLTLQELDVYRNTFRQSACNTQILVKISEKLCGITKLGLNDINTPNSPIVNNALSHFKYLESLNMDQHPPNAVRSPRLFSSVEPDYNQDEAMILSWASDERCPALRKCRLPSMSCIFLVLSVT
ncbi:hypothetical protein C8J55DRAFT_495898 [Lentinula edodes]|uniref:F-box domain-containing protein n=1 Tax=Lentinula lateritia TaxID=40482 RepID=A0A9W9E1V5_9AGAR|nr:hypothetical protein C8J55DRAFT_495898 [Lentinula edodes]